MSFNSYYISTTIPYVNSNPHIGHAQEFVLADALVRYYSSLGKNVHFQSGTDDNATKNVLSANQNNVPVQQFVDNNSAKFQNLQTLLDVFPNKFVRTSSLEHHQAVSQFLNRINKDDIYESHYHGNYCSGCEDFLNNTDLTENGLCPDHLRPPETIQEKNIFFRLSKYQSQLAELIEKDIIKITPSYKKNEILKFIQDGLTDISLSRSANRTLGWGIPYPEIPGQTVYVWIDALINYLTGIGFGRDDSWKNYWNNDIYKIHVIGKNVWKFHAIYWPALLLSAGIDLPNEIIIHGFLTNQGTKISKSLNNGSDPIETINRFGSDAVRFYLLGHLNYQNDSDFSEKNLVTVFNSELANKFGNLVSRSLTLVNTAQLKTFDADCSYGTGSNNTQLLPLQINKNNEIIDFSKIVKTSFLEINRINHEINLEKPWELKNIPDIDKRNLLLYNWINSLLSIAKNLTPIIPKGCHQLRKLILSNASISLDDSSLTKIPPLYPRIK